jgi:DNA-binding transcriptional LysR family regulator
MGWTASDFERLDPRLFRSFLAVVKMQSFSAAGEDAALTQGAVSQQIAKLEDRLNTQLFVRAGTRVVLTSSGQLLAAYAKAYMEHATQFLEQLNEEFESLRGEVSYAMPESCIHAPHFGWLLERRRAHPDIVLRIELRPSAEVVRELLQGKIDFGFVNRAVDSPHVQEYPFCFEEYVLVQSGHEPPLAMPRSLDELLHLPMVMYPGMIDCLNHWIRAQFCESDPIPAVALRVQGEFNDMRGALAMVEGALGSTVMPVHVVQACVERGQARIVRRDQEQPQSAARQQISIVRLRDRRMPARVKRVIRWFLDMHTDLQPVPAEFLT